MVRTKAGCGGAGGAYRKVVAARAPRKVLGPSSSVNSGSSPPTKRVESKYAGGNPVCVRPIPTWQKGIGEFFRQSPGSSRKENQVLDDEEAGSSGKGRSSKKACPLPPDPTEDDASSEDEQM
ncbi:PCNA-associated factor [Alligator mississippiensis]|uniref:PCNA-associated factor n=1 Tax=Alligator mississippiensis TaxID=8496 RepID=A0A151MAD6_ALLMI|nr:PCNA-associated factor [Alligator mississippiensis]KYO21474.1 PCNA-associated factor [Alligator mississippiensis]